MNSNNLNEQEYLSIVLERLKQQKYKIKDNIKYDNRTISYVAKRTKFGVERFGLFTTFFILARLVKSDIITLSEFSKKAFRYARKTRGIFPPPGLFYGFLCFPVAIVDSIDSETIDLVHNTEPPKHFAASEKIVVFSLGSQELYYCEKTFNYGFLYYNWDRVIINAMLSP